jgi:hypothetical protein
MAGLVNMMTSMMSRLLVTDAAQVVTQRRESSLCPCQLEVDRREIGGSVDVKFAHRWPRPAITRCQGSEKCDLNESAK